MPALLATLCHAASGCPFVGYTLGPCWYCVNVPPLWQLCTFCEAGCVEVSVAHLERAFGGLSLCATRYVCGSVPALVGLPCGHLIMYCVQQLACEYEFVGAFIAGAYD